MSSPSSRYKLVALDLDGTVISTDLLVSPRVKAAVRQAMEAGMVVTLATGRMFRAALPYAQELELRAPLICYQGAMIKNPEDQRVLYHQPVPLHLARQVLQVVQEQGLHVNVYLDDQLYVSEINRWAQAYANIARVPINAVGDLSAFLKADPTKMVIVSDPPVNDVVSRELKERFRDVLFITKSYPIFCEVAHPECSKSQALARLCDLLGIKQHETVAVGDNANDADMVEWAGLGVAMGNATQEVLDVAQMVTGTVQEDGVARVLEGLVGG
ncbi:MAG: HAD family phosphatase [Chloroflexota bacterium]|nr:MAG: HAD family phosphatase [Chloroflexota bacterium]